MEISGKESGACFNIFYHPSPDCAPCMLTSSSQTTHITQHFMAWKRFNAHFHAAALGEVFLLLLWLLNNDLMSTTHRASESGGEVATLLTTKTSGIKSSSSVMYNTQPETRTAVSQQPKRMKEVQGTNL